MHIIGKGRYARETYPAGHGPPGPQGAAGAQGAQGPQGAPGETSSTIESLQSDVAIEESTTVLTHARVLPPAGWRIEVEWSLGFDTVGVGGNLATTLFIDNDGGAAFLYVVLNGGGSTAADTSSPSTMAMRVVFDVPAAHAGVAAIFRLQGEFLNFADGNARVFGVNSAASGSGGATMKVTYHPPGTFPGTVGTATLIP